VSKRQLKFGNSGRGVIGGLAEPAQSDSSEADHVPKPRVLLADDNSAMRDLVSKMLADEYEVVDALRDGSAVLREYPLLRPDVLLLSMSVGDLSGIEVGQQLWRSGYDAHIVLMTVEEEPDFVRSALGAGASAYVLKFRLGTDLLPAIRAALVGKLFVSPTLLYAAE
jgi:DNA-binding NarL/FixJ family response regulator